MQETQVRYLGGKVPWQRKRQSTPPFLPRKSHGQEPGGLQTTEPSPQTRTVHYTPQSAEPNPPPAPSYLTWSLVLKEDTDCSEAHKSGSSAFASSSEFVDCGNFDTQDTQDEEKCTFLYPGAKEEGGGRAGSCEQKKPCLDSSGALGEGMGHSQRAVPEKKKQCQICTYVPVV